MIEPKRKMIQRRGKQMLDHLSDQRLEEAVDFLEFLMEKEEPEESVTSILGHLHKEAREKKIPSMTAEEAAELVHQVRQKKRSVG